MQVARYIRSGVSAAGSALVKSSRCKLPGIGSGVSAAGCALVKSSQGRLPGVSSGVSALISAPSLPAPSAPCCLAGCQALGQVSVQ